MCDASVIASMDGQDDALHPDVSCVQIGGWRAGKYRVTATTPDLPAGTVDVVVPMDDCGIIPQQATIELAAKF